MNMLMVIYNNLHGDCLFVCLFLCLLHLEYQNTHYTSEARTFWLVLATSKACLRDPSWFPGWLGQGFSSGLGLGVEVS